MRLARQVENLASERLAVVVISTYTDGTPPESAAWFCRWLEESATDFRVGAGMLQVRLHPLGQVERGASALFINCHACLVRSTSTAIKKKEWQCL